MITNGEITLADISQDSLDSRYLQAVFDSTEILEQLDSLTELILNTEDVREIFEVEYKKRNLLTYKRHNQYECEEKGGIYFEISADEKFCKMNGNKCPSGWNQYKSWSETTSQTCYKHWLYGNGGPCTTKSHSFSNNKKIETCKYKGVFGYYTNACLKEHTCSAKVTKVGCY